MATNKRLLVTARSTFAQDEVPVVDPPQGSVVVKITHSGVCFSDVHMAHTPGFHPKFVWPRVLGHEIAGTVYKFSSEAQKARPDLAVGDRVVVFPWGNCQKCAFCRSDCSFCSTSAYGAGPVGSYVYGVWRDGGYQNYVTVDVPKFLEKIPEVIPSREACLIACSGLTAYNAAMGLRESIERAKRAHGTALIGIIGAGGLGLWAIQIIKAVYEPGVKIVAVDINASKLEEAKKAGADITHAWDRDSPAKDASDGLVAACGARLDGAVDFTGVPPVLERGHLSLNLGGTLVLVGLGGDMMPAMTVNSVLRRNVTIRGSIVGSLPQLRELTTLVKDGKVKAPPIQEIRLDQVPEVMTKLQKGEITGRAVIKM